MKIILEGPDGAGKSTIANKISTEFNLKVQHVSGSDPNNYNWYIETFKNDNVVFDRHFLGELIYPTVFNRQQRITNKEFKKLLKYIKENNILLIIIMADKQTILKRFTERKIKEDDRIIKYLDWTITQFKYYAKKYKFAMFETTNADIDKKINKFIKENL